MSKFRIVVVSLVVLLAAGLIPAQAARASIASVSGSVVQTAAPANTKNGVFVSDVSIFAYNERQGSRSLHRSRSTRRHREITRTVNSWRGGSIPAGAIVDSHVVHADHTKTNSLLYSGTVTFQTDILGIIFADTKLMDTDAVLGSPTTIYPGNLFGRGLEIGNGDAVNWVIRAQSR